MFENTAGLERGPFSPSLQSYGMNWIHKQMFISIITDLCDTGKIIFL